MEQDTADMIAEAGKFLDPAVTILDRLTARQIRTISLFDPDYPILLNELNDPPTLLFIRGDLPRSDLKTVALSGTSGAAFEGMEMTTRLAREFSEAGVQIISGMTSGIAASAHLAARGAGGRSFAVLDSGFDRIIETDLMPLAIDLANYGGVISEYLPEPEATATSFKQSNRLMAGLAQGVVITEMYHDSEKTLDLLKVCAEIGKLAFVMIDPEQGVFADEPSLTKALEYGAIPLEGYEHVPDIIRALV